VGTIFLGSTFRLCSTTSHEDPLGFNTPGEEPASGGGGGGGDEGGCDGGCEGG
jgi:hypothetical protein